MNIIEAIDALKNGKAIRRCGWNGTYVQAAELENRFQMFASGDLNPEMLVLMAGDYEEVESIGKE